MHVLARMLCFMLLAACAHAVDDPWADEVLSYVSGPNMPSGPYADASVAIGAPEGAGTNYGNTTSIVSLGSISDTARGQLVLKFNTPVEDDPENPMGLDCIVFGNAFWTGNNPQVRFQEPALIEISQDVNGNGLADDPWYLIPGSRAYQYGADGSLPTISEPTGQSNSATNPYYLAGNIKNPNAYDDAVDDTIEYNWGYGDTTPNLPHYLDYHLRPDDPLTVGLSEPCAGGDAFDIAWAVDQAGEPADLSQFDSIRFSTFVLRNTGVVGYMSPEVDAVADVAPDVDTDGDGLLDAYETRVAGTDPLRSENTVLPLEIPSWAGGVPATNVLGEAHDSRGDRLALYAAGTRDAELPRETTVDMLTPSAPEGSLPNAGLLLSGTVLEIVSDVADFPAMQIAPAEVALVYAPAEITGLDEAGLQPYRFDGAAYTQDGIASIVLDADANQVTFQTDYPGVFVLASTAGIGETNPITEPPVAPVGWVVQVTGSAPAVLQFESTILQDRFGHMVADGVFVTIVVAGGTITSADADPDAPGYQAAVEDGQVRFTVEAEGLLSAVTVQTYTDAGQAERVGEGTYLPADYVALPLAAPGCALLLFTLGAMRLLGSRRRCQS